MLLFDPTLFLAALSQLLLSDGVAVSFTEDELCFMANSECPHEHQLPYARYVDFISRLASEGPKVYSDTPNGEAYYQVYAMIKTAMLQQKLAMVKAIVAGEPNWRAMKWLLDRRDKEARSRKQKGTLEGIDYCVEGNAQECSTRPVTAHPEVVANDQAPREKTRPLAKRRRYYTGSAYAHKGDTSQDKSSDTLREPKNLSGWQGIAAPYMRQLKRGVGG